MMHLARAVPFTFAKLQHLQQLCDTGQLSPSFVGGDSGWDSSESLPKVMLPASGGRGTEHLALGTRQLWAGREALLRPGDQTAVGGPGHAELAVHRAVHVPRSSELGTRCCGAPGTLEGPGLSLGCARLLLPFPKCTN